MLKFVAGLGLGLAVYHVSLAHLVANKELWDRFVDEMNEVFHNGTE